MSTHQDHAAAPGMAVPGTHRWPGSLPQRGFGPIGAWRRAGRRREAIAAGLTAAGLLFAGYLAFVGAPRQATVGFDAFAYWSVAINDPYRIPHGVIGAFVYSPVVARLFAPASLLPWPTFFWLWSAGLLATALWLGGRRWLWVLAFPPVVVELYHGNVHLLIAAAIALGFRYPAAWAFVLLTKVTPGVGLVWFAVRREWRNLAIALGVTAALVALSLVVDLPLWRGWLERDLLVSLRQPPDQPQIAVPLLLRLPLAVVLVAWGAVTDRRWTVPLAATLALPVMWFAGFSIMAALPALNRPELRERPRGRTLIVDRISRPAISAVAPSRPEASASGQPGVSP
jgi:hypothetical protein